MEILAAPPAGVLGTDNVQMRIQPEIELNPASGQAISASEILDLTASQLQRLHSRMSGNAAGMGIEEVLIAPRSPWQSPYVERMIGSIRRECLDHILVINRAHLRRVLREYFAYYHDSRPHQSLDGNAPRPREIEPPSQGRIVAEPQVGGLHHRYRRAA